MDSPRHKRIKERVNGILKDPTLFPRTHNTVNPLEEIYDGKVGKAVDDIILNYVRRGRIDLFHNPMHSILSDYAEDNISFIVDCSNEIEIYGHLR